MWSLEDRKKFIEDTFKGNSKIKVKTYEGLTVDFCRSIDARFILRGLRNSLDFSYEKSIAQNNTKLGGVESIFLVCSPEVSHVSSTIVRDIARNNGDYSALVPDGV